MVDTKRLASVDALRGITVAGMLLVNDPGDWSHIYAPLEHAAWHGFTPTDLIFPLFLFIVGVSIALAFGPQVEKGRSPAQLQQVVWMRALRIVLLGLALHAFAYWMMDKPNFRIMGVLQRIGICFALGGTAYLYCSARTQWLMIGGLLLGYWALLHFGGPLSLEGNIASRVDAQVLGRFAYEFNVTTGWGHDPEGLVSTIGAFVTVLFGIRSGVALRQGQRAQLFGGALLCLLVGYLWQQILPFNKQLWTSSFIIWSAGWSMLALAAANWLIDDLHWPAIGRVFGVNAITAYALAWVATCLLEGLHIAGPLYHHGFGWAINLVSPNFASLSFALCFVAFWWPFMWLLDRHRIYIKI